MDISKLKRDATKVHKDLTVTGTTIVTKRGCKVYIPARYEEQGLATLGTETSILGFFAIVYDDGTYGVSTAITIVKTAPDEINTIKIEDEGYIELVYNPGSTVISNTSVLKDENLLFLTWDEFISKGKIPWFLNYEDLGKIYALSAQYTGITLGANHAILELIAAVISRDPAKLQSHYRHIIKSKKDLLTNPPVIIKLNSVTYGATNTTAKLIGGYYDEGVNSALINPSQKKEAIEDLLRQ